VFLYEQNKILIIDTIFVTECTRRGGGRKRGRSVTLFRTSESHTGTDESKSEGLLNELVIGELGCLGIP